jgi:hypothetical protein
MAVRMGGIVASGGALLRAAHACAAHRLAAYVAAGQARTVTQTGIAREQEFGTLA